MKGIIRKHILLLLIIAFWICALIVFIMLASGRAKIWNNGVCVDEFERIYVGLEKEIRIFDKNGNAVRTIQTPTSADYSFHVENNRIYYSKYPELYVLDLEGKVLSYKTDSYKTALRKASSTYTVNGSIYHVTAKRFYYRVTVERDGEETTIVHMPVSDMLVIFGFLLWPLDMALIFVYIKQEKQSKNNHGDGSMC